MDTALPQKFPFILDRNLAKANSTENHVCTSCVTVVLVSSLHNINTLTSSAKSSAVNWSEGCVEFDDEEDAGEESE